MFSKVLPAWIAGAVLLLAVNPVEAAGPVNKALDTVEQTNAAAAASQEKIDNLSAKTRKMLTEYRNAIRQTQQLKVYNDQLADIVVEQKQRKQRLQRRIKTIGDLRGEVRPLMLRMLDTLQRFVEADLPFKRKQREQKLAQLSQAMADASLGVAQKFDKVLDAYQREAKYGRTIGTYPGKLTFDGRTRMVDFLRIGRVMLFYITPDNAYVGYYDPQSGQWQPLRASYRDAIRKGVKLAQGAIATQLITIAAPAPTPVGDNAAQQQADSGTGGA